ncbi:MAG: response regulator transcription factor [Ruminococcaceae bacterium]|nr:response regulator transcription factor [Oscillospiraceae bacterium]
MRIALCDDSSYDLELIKNIILEDANIRDTQVDTFTRGDDLLNNIEKGINYDIAFLDIEMPGIKGIDLALKIKSMLQACIIIFLTNYPQYAIEGYGCEALRYLLKPCNKIELKTTLERAFQLIEEKTHYIPIKIKKKTIAIRLDDLYYVELCNRHLLFHMENEVIESVGTISNVYDKLKYYGFLQVHQGYIVNMDKINNLKNDIVILSGGKTVPLSIRKKSEVYSEYAKYLERH